MAPTDASDDGARLARVTLRSHEAIGSPDKANRWLVTPNRALSGRKPIELLNSDEGAALVEEILGRIEHGIYG